MQMLTNTTETITFLIDALTATPSQTATLVDVQNTLNSFSADFYNALKGLGSVTPTTTLMSNGVPSHLAIPQINSRFIDSGVFTQFSIFAVPFNQLRIGNCFGDMQAYVPDPTVYGLPSWLTSASVTKALVKRPEINDFPIYDNAWTTVGNSLNCSIIKINNSITTPLKFTERFTPSATTEIPFNTVGRLIEVNETLWNALVSGNLTTYGDTRYNAMGRALFAVLNRSYAYSAATLAVPETILHGMLTKRRLSRLDLDIMQTIWKNTKRGTWFASPTFTY